MYISKLSSTKQVSFVIAIFILIHAVILLTMPLLPFVDLPNHLAEATIYKYYDQPGNVLAQYYQPTPWYFPNTFHTVFCSLFPTVELGNKIFHILYIIMLQVSLYLVIRYLKGNQWYGLLGLLFTYNYNLTFGFVGFAISIPTIIILFYITLLDLEKDTLGLKLIVSFLLVLLFLMHAQNALFGLLVYGLMMLYHYRKSFIKLIVRAVLIPLPLVILIFTWWFTRGGEKEESTANYLFNYYTSDYFTDFINRLRIVKFDNFQLADGVIGTIIAASIFSLILLPLLYFKPWKNQTVKIFITANTPHALLFFAASLGCYLLLPDKLPGQSPLYQRFCTIVIFSFIILASVWLKHVKAAALKYFVTTAALCYSLLWFEYIYTFNRINQSFTKDFFKGASNQARLAALIYDTQYRGRPVYIHYPNYFLVWNKGLVASKIIDYRFGVVKRVAPESVIPFYHELIGETHSERPTPEYSNLEYILVRGDGPLQMDLKLGQFTLAKRETPWQLYRKKK